MNITPLSMNNADNYSTQKKKQNPNFKQVFIVKDTNMLEALKEKSTLNYVKKFTQILEQAGSRFFDSYVYSNKSGVIRFFLKFKEGFNWPWNNGCCIYTTSDCDSDKGEFKFPEKRPGYIKFRFNDENDHTHFCFLEPSTDKTGEYFLRHDSENTNELSEAKDVPVLDNLLETMANGEVYGESESSYKLQYHPFPTPEERQQDIEANRAARQASLISTDEEINALLGQYGVEVQ